MKLIYHIAEAGVWDPGEAEYAAASLGTEGFIHCSERGQLPGVVQRYYSDRSGLVLLTIDASKVRTLVYEDLLGTGEPFPHVYGPVPRSAIVKAETFEP